MDFYHMKIHLITKLVCWLCRGRINWFVVLALYLQHNLLIPLWKCEKTTDVLFQWLILRCCWSRSAPLTSPQKPLFTAMRQIWPRCVFWEEKLCLDFTWTTSGKTVNLKGNLRCRTAQKYAAKRFYNQHFYNIHICENLHFQKKLWLRAKHKQQYNSW